MSVDFILEAWLVPAATFPAPVPKADVAHAIQQLRRFYATGRDRLNRFKGEMKHGRMPGEAKRAGLQAEMLRKARSFADRYPPAELDELCALARHHRFLIGVTHAIRLITVPPNVRPKLQRELIEGHWSTGKLNLEIRRRFHKRKRLKKLRHVSADPFDAYNQLDNICTAWGRLYRALCREHGDGAKQASNGELRQDLPHNVRQGVRAANEAMAKLGKHVEKAMTNV